jgi:hypothetical protein
MTGLTQQPNGKIQIGLMMDFYAALANQVELDIDIAHLLKKLTSYNPRL